MGKNYDFWSAKSRRENSTYRMRDDLISPKFQTRSSEEAQFRNWLETILPSRLMIWYKFYFRFRQFCVWIQADNLSGPAKKSVAQFRYVFCTKLFFRVLGVFFYYFFEKRFDRRFKKDDAWGKEREASGRKYEIDFLRRTKTRKRVFSFWLFLKKKKSWSNEFGFFLDFF